MSTAQLLTWLGIVWMITAGCVFGLGWQTRAWLADRQLADALADQPVPYQVTRSGWMTGIYGPPSASASYGTWNPPRRFQGAADPAFEAPVPPDAMAMAAAAYRLGQEAMTADEARREVNAIWAEIEADPERWQA
jgi:hypothetical protein